MILHPAIVDLVIVSFLMTAMSLSGAFFGIRIIRRWDLASGSVIEGIEPPRSTTVRDSVTSLIDGWMCSVMLLPSSICGVTSSITPEKNGATVTVGVCCVVVPVVVVTVATLVTKNSSVPTLSTAF